MASKVLFAVLAAFLALQVSAIAVPRSTDLNTVEGMFSTLVDILDKAFHVADHGANYIKDNSEAISKAMINITSEKIRAVGKIVISDIENLEKEGSSEEASACLTVEKHKVQGFVESAIDQSTVCISENYKGLYDPLDEFVLGLDWLNHNATKLEEKFAACEENDGVCKLLVMHDVYELFVNVPRTNLGSGARALVQAQKTVSACIANGVLDMKQELETLYAEATKCLGK